MKTLQQKALAWEAFQAGSRGERTTVEFRAIEEAMRLAFEEWWRTYRAQKAAAKLRPPTAPKRLQLKPPIRRPR